MSSSALFGKQVGKTEYTNVYEWTVKEGSASKVREPNYFRAIMNIKGKKFTVRGLTAKAAALALDKKLISEGLEPINVLKRVI